MMIVYLSGVVDEPDYVVNNATSIGVLQTFWHQRMVEKALDLFGTRGMKVMVDSGAFSWYWQHVARKYGERAKGVVVIDYLTWPEWKQYVDKYISWLHQYKQAAEVYVTLDIIGSPEGSWQMWEYMRSCGLDPLPVWHDGEDLKWLDKYLSNCDYVGIGGMVGSTVEKKWQVYDTVWRVVGLDKDYSPAKKLHAFGLLSLDMLFQYPWYSVDATSWAKLAAYGKARFWVQRADGSIDWQLSLTDVRCSRRTIGSGVGGSMMWFEDFVNLVGEQWVAEYLTKAGFQPPEGTALVDYVDVVKVRRGLNIYYFEQLQQYLNSPSGQEYWKEQYLKRLNNVSLKRRVFI